MAINGILKKYVPQNLSARLDHYYWYQENYERLSDANFRQNYAQKEVYYRDHFWLYQREF